MKFLRDKDKEIIKELEERNEYINKAILEKGEELQKLLDDGTLVKYEKRNSATIISTCLECGSNNIFIEEDISYDCDECPYVDGYYLKCNDCGNIDEN